MVTWWQRLLGIFPVSSWQDAWNKASYRMVQQVEKQKIREERLAPSLSNEELTTSTCITAMIAWRGITKRMDHSNILTNCSGLVSAGSLVALLGPSGCGKTSLLRVLAGLDSCKTVSGEVFYGSRHVLFPSSSNELSVSCRRQIGFVPQYDLFMEMLTVSEHLQYACLLRGNGDKEHIDSIMRTLSIFHLAERCIAQLSGGERKRCSIATELLSSPLFLLLDEATSGLDSAVALTLVMYLRDLSRGICGMTRRLTILMSIHQPATGLFMAFDDVMFLSQGRVVYSGSPSQLVSVLQSYGIYSRSSHINPADFMLEILATGSSGDGGWWTQSWLVYFYSDAHVLRLIEHSLTTERDLDSLYVVGQQPFLNEVNVLFWRSWQSSVRSAAYHWLSYIEVFYVSFLAGATWFQTFPLKESKVGAAAGLLFFLVTYWFFHGLYGGVLDFFPEKQVLLFEQSRAAYRLSSYYLARILCGLLSRLIMPMLAVTIVLIPALYWSSATSMTTISSLSVLIGLCCLLGESLGTLISVLCGHIEHSVTLATLCAISMTVFGGFYLHPLPSYMNYFAPLSLIKLAYDCLIQILYWDEMEVECDVKGDVIGDCRANKQIHAVAVQRWLGADRLPRRINVAYLIGTFVLLKLAGYMALRRLMYGMQYY